MSDVFVDLSIAALVADALLPFSLIPSLPLFLLALFVVGSH